MKIINIIQGSDEWLKYRRSRLGASDMAKVLNISPFGTPLSLFEEKKFGKNVYVNSSMKRGREKEKQGIEKSQTFLQTIFEPKVIEHEKYPFLFASLDGVDMMRTIVEVKWCNSVVHSLAKKGIVVDYYYSQCQLQMECAGVDEMWFVSCFETPVDFPEYEFVKVKRDQLFIDKMIEKSSHFYHEYMCKDTPPPHTEKDYKDVDETSIKIFNDLISEYLDLSKSIQDMESKKEDIKKIVKKIASDRSVKSERFKATKCIGKGRIDYEKIIELNGVDLEIYRKEPTECWRFTEHKNN